VHFDHYWLLSSDVIKDRMETQSNQSGNAGAGRRAHESDRRAGLELPERSKTFEYRCQAGGIALKAWNNPRSFHLAFSHKSLANR
jgi:hypothetical protein